MSKNYEIKRAKAPVERITLHLSEPSFEDIFNTYKKNFPNYYAAAKRGEYADGDLMATLVNVARELGYEL